MTGVWREPAERTEDYPGLVVWDARVSGSITTGDSRLPLWAFAGVVARHGWSEAESGWEPSEYGWDAEAHDHFIYNLMEMRGEFARLLCVLADVERREQEREEQDFQNDHPWWADDLDRERVVQQLERCLDVLNGVPPRPDKENA